MPEKKMYQLTLDEQEVTALDHAFATYCLRGLGGSETGIGAFMENCALEFFRADENHDAIEGLAKKMQKLLEARE